MCLHEYIFLYPWSTGMKQVFFYQIISECNSQFWFNVMSWVSRIRDILVVNYRCKNITTIKKINKISVLQLLKLLCFENVELVVSKVINTYIEVAQEGVFNRARHNDCEYLACFQPKKKSIFFITVRAPL